MITVLQVSEEREVIVAFQDWVTFFLSAHRRDVLNIVSIDMLSTPLASLISLPSVVQKLDLASELSAITIETSSSENFKGAQEQGAPMANQ